MWRGVWTPVSELEESVDSADVFCVLCSDNRTSETCCCVVEGEVVEGEDAGAATVLTAGIEVEGCW